MSKPVQHSSSVLINHLLMQIDSGLRLCGEEIPIIGITRIGLLAFKITIDEISGEGILLLSIAKIGSVMSRVIESQINGHPPERIISAIDQSDCLIHRLPPGVLAKVFSFLDISSQWRGRVVCKTWNRYSRDINFCRVVRSGESWRSHQTVHDLKRTIPRFRDLQQDLFVNRLTRSAFCVFKSIASVILIAKGRSWLKEVGNTRRAAIASMSHEETLAVMKAYNKSDVFEYDFGFRTRLPNEMIITPHMMIEAMLFDVFLVNDFLPTAGLMISKLIISLITISKVQDLWRMAPRECSQKLRDRLSLPADLASDPVLSQYLCPVSGRVMLLPVEDSCAGVHVFDYLSIQDHTITVIHCPISIPNAVIPPEHLRFREDIFFIVQNRLRDLGKRSF